MRPNMYFDDGGQYTLALPGVSLLGTIVNGYFQNKQYKQRQHEHRENSEIRERHHNDLLDAQRQQAKQGHYWRLEEPNWPLIISPDQYASHTTSHGKQPLAVMLSPPPESDLQFRDVIKDIENELRVLLQNGYAINDARRPVDFRAKAWKSGAVGGEAQAHALFHALSKVPTLIIDLEMISGDLFIYTHYWGIGAAEDPPFLSHASLHEQALPLSTYIAEIVRRDTRKILEIATLLGDQPLKLREHELKNIEILRQEDKLRETDPNSTFFVRHYVYNPEQLRLAVRQITPALQLLVASVADLYHLCRYGIPPYMPSLLARLFSDIKDNQVSALMKQIIADYVRTIDLIANRHPEWVPPFHLGIAEALIGSVNTDLCRDHTLKSLSSWRGLRGADKTHFDALSLLRGMQSYVKQEDKIYLLRTQNLLNILDQISAALEALRLSENIQSLTVEQEQILKTVEEELRERLEQAKGKRFTFLLMGRTGVGKSSTINSLMGEEIAPVGDFDPTTFEVKVFETELQGAIIRVVDTPGLCDTLPEEGKDAEYLNLIASKMPQAIDAVLFVTRLDDSRVDSSEKRGIKLITEAFGDKYWQRSIIVFTRSRQISSHRFEEYLTERTKRIHSELLNFGVSSEIVSQIKAVAVDNNSPDGTNPDGKKWMPQLYNAILALTKNNENNDAFVLSTIHRLDDMGFTAEEKSAVITAMSVSGFFSFVLVLGLVSNPIGWAALAASVVGATAAFSIQKNKNKDKKKGEP